MYVGGDTKQAIEFAWPYELLSLGIRHNKSDSYTYSAEFGRENTQLNIFLQHQQSS